MRLASGICLSFLGVVAAHASLTSPAFITTGTPAFTAFTASQSAETPFTETINSSLSANQVAITNTSISCAAANCSGNAADYSGTVSNAFTGSPLTINIDGSLTGTNSITGSVTVAVPNPLLFTSLTAKASTLSQTYTFTVSPGTFNTLIAVTSLPPAFLNNTNFSGTVSFQGLTQGQTLTLPNSLDFTLAGPKSAVPEPGTWALFTVALGGLGLVRYRAKRQA